MSYDRSHVRDYAIIQGITLLENMIKRLEKDRVDLETVFGDWQRDSTLGFESQVRVIWGTSADDKACEYLVDCLTELNSHKMCEFPLREYLITLTDNCIDAVFRAIKAHSHIWNKAQLHTVLNALGSGHVIAGRSLPYYGAPEDEDEDEKEKKKSFVIGK